MRIIIPIIIFNLLLLLYGCKKEAESVSNQLIGESVPFSVPDGFPPSQMFIQEPLTREGILLGRKLFYDGRLSKDGSVSCASCHQQVAAFGTYDHDLSHGIYNQHSNRNAPPLFNLAWYSDFGWDGEFTKIESIADAHITSSTDMAGNYSTIVEKFKKDSDYPGLFKAAFGSPTINRERILKSLQQFIGSIVSVHTKYDSVRMGWASYSEIEMEGYELYKKYCNSCHAEPLFTDNSFRNNGLPPAAMNDIGRARITGASVDRYQFRVPTLRNLFLSFPFMHDGRFIGFSQIYEHYRLPGSMQNNLTDDLLRGGIELSQTERNAMTAFLRTLTDFDFPNKSEYKN